MTYALILVKGKSQLRERTLKLLSNLKKDPKFKEYNQIEILEVFISFGWPDIILLIRGNNVEILKLAIVEIRERIFKGHRDVIETSTIICTTIEDIFANKLANSKIK